MLVIGTIALAMLMYEWFSGLPADATAQYVGGSSCIECHQDQYDLFAGSHHDLAMDVANEETVLAKFDGTKIEHFGITSTVFRDGERFMVNTQGPDGQMQDFEVTMVFGCDPLQQYMVELKPARDADGHGQYQVLRLSWDVAKQQWFYLSPPDVYEQIHPDDPLHWTSVTQRWNSNCASCHSTDLQKNFDTLTGKYNTTFVDIDVNCEACHGPGSLHVEIAQNRRFFWDANHGLGLTTKLKDSKNMTQVEACAPCHSRRTQIESGDLKGQRYDEHFSCQLLSNRVYHDDGQIRDEDYVYGSFIQSKMYHRGIKCTDCHDPHSTKVKFTDNQLCTSCHQHPAGKYDTAAHHRHQAGSTGALCVECHMPATTYMAIDSRRDHSFRVPRPDLSVKFGTPNACTACHIDEKKLPETVQSKLTQYLDWIEATENGDEVVASELRRVDQQMADAFAQWYPDAKERADRSKYYEQLVAGKSDAPDSAQSLRQLALDDSAPAIFRATSAEELGTPDSDSVETLLQCLQDDEPKVVAAACRALTGPLILAFGDRSKAKDLVNKLAELLEHDSRLVRIEVARTLTNVPKQVLFQMLDSTARTELAATIEELKRSLAQDNDLAMSHMILASLHEWNEEFSAAETSYRNAIAVEPKFSGARTNLAQLIDGRIGQLSRRLASGESNLASQIESLQQSVKRYRAEENKLLKFEVDRSAGIAGVHGLHYRYGLSCYLNGDLEETEKWLLAAYQGSPKTQDYVLALATYYDATGDNAKARKFVKELLDIAPDNPAYRQLRDKLLSETK